MNITCGQCHKSFPIADDKLPKGKVFAVSCPACKQKVHIDTRPKPQETSPMDFQPLFSELEGATALVCDEDRSHQKVCREVLEALGYRVNISTDVADIVEKLRYQQFSLIVLKEDFKGFRREENPVLQQLQAMPMAQRRDAFFVLIGKSYKTLNRMLAFSESADLVVNEKDLPRLQAILKQAIRENERFYNVFKDSLKEMGKR